MLSLPQPGFPRPAKYQIKIQIDNFHTILGTFLRLMVPLNRVVKQAFLTILSQIALGFSHNLFSQNPKGLYSFNSFPEKFPPPPKKYV